jgi:hypothetical protein
MTRQRIASTIAGKGRPSDELPVALGWLVSREGPVMSEARVEVIGSRGSKGMGRCRTAGGGGKHPSSTACQSRNLINAQHLKPLPEALANNPPDPIPILVIGMRIDFDDPSICPT